MPCVYSPLYKGILQFTDFIKGQKLTLALRSRYLFLETQQLPGIALYVSLPPCRGQDDAENPETGTGGGLGERLSLRSERLGLQPLGIVGTEFLSMCMVNPESSGSGSGIMGSLVHAVAPKNSKAHTKSLCQCDVQSHIFKFVTFFSNHISNPKLISFFLAGYILLTPNLLGKEYVQSFFLHFL